MTDLQILLDLLDRGFAGEVAQNGQIICNLPHPFADYGISLEMFGSDSIGCTIWESYAGGILAQEGFQTLDKMLCWAFVVVANFDAALSNELANTANLS